MTRDEQITEASYNYSKLLNSEAAFDYEDMECAFKKGAEWADEHPVDVWHDASEEPTNYNIQIVYQEKSGICWFASQLDWFEYRWDWKRFVDNHQMVRWVYISDLLPKGGTR